jgi:subtilisin family serine protease
MILRLILLSILIALFFSSDADAKCKQRQIRIAIVDTGLDLKDPRFASLLCKDGHHYDFVHSRPMEADVYGHGTHIAGIIKEYAKHANYCLLIYRYYDSTGLGYNNLNNELRSIKQAADDRADILNFSGGGDDFAAAECRLIEEKKNVLFVVAAGNDGRNIDPPGGYFPASCNSSNVIPVGSLDKNDNRLPSSNFGTMVKRWELGLNVISTLPNGRMGMMSGTSQATAIATGKIVSQIKNKCDIGK